MATTVSVTSNYAGRDAGGFFLKTFKQIGAIQNGAVTIYDNVNYELWLKKLATTNGRRAYTCGFEPGGSITLTEKLLKPKKFKDDFDICKEVFRAQWGELSMGASAHNNVMNKEILDAIIANKLADNAEEFNSLIWSGDSTNTDEFDGFLKLFLADADVIDVDLDTVTESNVEAQIKLALGAVPIALIGNNNLKVSVSPDIAQFYNFFLASKGIANGLGGNANTSLVFGNYTLVVDLGLPANTIVVADPKNLAFGTGAMADHNTIDVVDEDSIGLLTGKVRGTMVYNAGVQYAYGAEIVWARPIA
jgi:hypothetical protein